MFLLLNATPHNTHFLSYLDSVLHLLQYFKIEKKLRAYECKDLYNRYKEFIDELPEGYMTFNEFKRKWDIAVGVYINRSRAVLFGESYWRYRDCGFWILFKKVTNDHSLCGVCPFDQKYCDNMIQFFTTKSDSSTIIKGSIYLAYVAKELHQYNKHEKLYNKLTQPFTRETRYDDLAT